MKRRFLAPLFACCLANASYGQALQGIVADTHHSGAAGFTGVGDVVSGALFHGGTIAYSTARRGNKMLNLCNGGVCADVNSDATTGIVPNAPTINGAACNNSTHICTVAVIYDDSGNTFCNGNVACDLNTLDSAAPIFVVSASGSVPGISCNGSTQALSSPAGFAAVHGQPLSSGASYSIASTGFTGSVTAVGTILLQAINSGRPEGFAGTGLIAGSAIATSTFVATTVTQDGSGNGSVETNNGTATTGSIGTNTIGAGVVYVCQDGFGEAFNGTVLEAYWYPAQFS